MKRREALRAFGAATALVLLPADAFAAWARVASGLRPTDGLSADRLALVGAIADTILPRTGSPGATDVGVPAFVDVIVSEQYGDAERAAFIDGLAAIDALVRTAPAVSTALESIEAAADRRGEPARTYWRLKGLIVHGYFTSEPVMKDVLKVEIMPGAFDGAAPLRPAGRSTGGHSHG